MRVASGQFPSKLLQDQEFFVFLASQRDLSIYGLATIATSFDINIVSG